MVAPTRPNHFIFFCVHKIFSFLVPQTNHSTLLARPHPAPPNLTIMFIFIARPPRPYHYVICFCDPEPFHFIWSRRARHANSSFYVFPVCTNQFTFLAHTNSACRSFHSFLHVHTLHPQTLIFNLHALTIMLFVFVFPNHFIFYGLANSPLHIIPVCPKPSTCLAHPNPAWW